MTDISILTETDLRQLVKLDMNVIDVIDTAFAQLGSEAVQVPPILHMEMPAANAEVDVKTAYIPGLDGFAIKVSSGFFDNPALGLPSLNGLMVVLSAKTGSVSALLLDNGYLTDIRTAAAGAVVSRHLAPASVEVVAVFGAGVQAQLQLQALALVRPFKRVNVWARNEQKAQAFADKMQTVLGVAVTAVADGYSCVKSAQVAITTTPSRTPIFRTEWLHSGLHITAVGSDAPGKQELEPGVIAKADLFVCDRQAQSATVGELRSVLSSDVLHDSDSTLELGSICTGQSAGRPDDHAVTVCDLTGVGVQDTAIADYAVRQAAIAGLGTTIRK